MLPRPRRLFPWFLLTLILLVAGCGGGGGGGGGSATNLAPVLDPIGNQVVTVGETLNLNLRASDPNSGDTVRIFTSPQGDPRLSSTPGNPASATFSWTPTSADSANPVAITFIASDGLLEVSQAIVITVNTPAAPPPGNSPPVLAPIGNRSINDGSNLSFTVSASDADGDAVSLGVAGLPDGASFDGNTGAFFWTPSPTQVGNHVLTFSAEDGQANDSETITITVAGGVIPNSPPVLGIIGDKTVTVGATLNFTVSASDPDGDAVTLRVLGLPNGAGFNSATGLFTWTPALGDVGISSLTFEASDAQSIDSQTITIQVEQPPPPVNTPPVLAPIGNRSINAGSNLSFTVSASDADGDTLILSVAGLPTGASFDAATGLFSWTPGPGDLGNHPVTFSVSDGTAPPVEEQIVISVVNSAPVITVTTPPPAQITENELVTVGIAVSDPDAGDTLTVSASGSALDHGGAFHYDPATQTGTFTWTPAIVTAGSYSITFAASDDTSSVAHSEIIVYVRTNPLLATDSGLAGITIFNQNIIALDGNSEVFPGQANFWDLDLDGALVDGFWDQFDGNLFLSVQDNASTVFFPLNQTYPELQFLTPVMTALDGIKVAAVAHHDSYAGPDPRLPISAVVGEGNYSAWLNATADSRLQQILQLETATTPVVFSVQDEVLAQVGEFKDASNTPYYRIVLRDPTTGALLQTLFEPPLTDGNVVVPRASRSIPLDPAVLGRNVLLAFEFRAANGTLFNPVTSNADFYGSYARIDNVSISDGSREFVQNGNFETGNLSGWTTNVARESQNIRFGMRNVNELEVTRHFYTPPNQLWARWVDVFENQTAVPLVKTVNLHSILGAWGGAVVYPHPGSTAPDIRALTIWDSGAGDRSLRDVDAPYYRDSGLVFGNAASVSFTSATDLVSANGDDFIDIQHLLVVPPGGRVTLVHFTILSGESTGKTALSTAAQATTIDIERDRILNNFWTDPRYRDGMTQEQIDSILNFPQGGF